MFELRWAFRIQSSDKEEDDKKILAADISQFEGFSTDEEQEECEPLRWLERPMQQQAREEGGEEGLGLI